MDTGCKHLHSATSLILAQPNFHYPIPTSFETSSTWPHGLGVCGATKEQGLESHDVKVLGTVN